MEQKNDRQKWLRMTARVGAILFGNAIYAMAVVLFIMPNGLVTGGTTGMGLFFNRLWGIPVSLFVSIFNIAVFGLGLWQLGKGDRVSSGKAAKRSKGYLCQKAFRIYYRF